LLVVIGYILAQGSDIGLMLFACVEIIVSCVSLDLMSLKTFRGGGCWRCEHN